MLYLHSSNLNRTSTAFSNLKLLGASRGFPVPPQLIRHQINIPFEDFELSASKATEVA